MILLPLVVALVTAYHKTTPTATGTRPHIGVCAGPRAYLRHDVIIAGRRYHVEDTTRNGAFDIWMPTRGQCRRWGRRRMEVRVVHPRGERGHRVERRRVRARGKGGSHRHATRRHHRRRGR